MTTSLHINLPKHATIGDLKATLEKIPDSSRITDDVGRPIREVVVGGDGDVTLTPLPPISTRQRDTIEFVMPPELIALARRSSPEAADSR